MMNNYALALFADGTHTVIGPIGTFDETFDFLVNADVDWDENTVFHIGPLVSINRVIPGGSVHRDMPEMGVLNIFGENHV